MAAKRKKAHPDGGLRAYLKEVKALSFQGRRWSPSSIRRMRDFLAPWDHNIPLGDGVFTADCPDYYPAHREIMRVVADELRGGFRGKRIADLGCLDGYFSVECARQGASVLGVDGRILNIKKCEFVRSVLRIRNARFVQDDAMRVTRRRYGSFDAVLALGLLYHLSDPFRFLRNMASVTQGFIVIDTHVALHRQPRRIKGDWKPCLSELQEFRFGGNTYEGRLYREFEPGAATVVKDLSRTAALRNDDAVWLTEESLVEMLHDAGFLSVRKCLYPASSSTWWSDMHREARVLLVACRQRIAYESQLFRSQPFARTSRSV